MKKLIALLLTLSMTLTLSVGLAGCSNSNNNDAPPPANGGTAAPEKKVTFKLSHYRADGSPADIDLDNFSDRVAELTGDSLDVVVYPAAQLGDYTVVQEMVSVGDVEMQMATLGTSVDKFFGIASAPYIASNWDEAYKIFNADSELTAMLEEHLAAQNIKMLAVYPLYFGGAILTKEPQGDPGNLDTYKGVKIRCQSMKASEMVTTMLGYIATPMALNDCFTSLQTGVIDGMIGSGAEGYYSNYRDLSNYYLPYNDHFEVWYLYVNQDKFDALSPAQQEAMITAAKEMEEARWKVAPDQTKEYEKKLADNGTVIIDFTEEELATFAQKCADEIWPQLVDLYGQEAVDLVAKLRNS